MVVYAAVPTSGLPALDASDYSKLLQFAATTGQTPGLGVGQLPPGYLPMTEANGLGALANYTWAAAADVAAQKGEVPSVTADLGTAGSSPTTTTVPPTTVTTTTLPPTTTVPPTTVPPTTVPPTTVPPTTVPPTTVPPTTVPPTTVPPTTVATTTVPPTTVTTTTIPQVSGRVAIGRTVGVPISTSGRLVVLILLLALVGIVGVPVTYLVGRRRGRW
jgi:hypothetical protein